MIRAIINGDKKVELESSKDQWNIDGESVSFDISSLGDNQYHLILNQRSYNAELLSYNRRNKSFIWSINGRKTEIKLEDSFDILLEKMGIDKNVSNKVSEIHAPMPGLVLDIMIKEGQHIDEGEALFVLEAMKMENIIKSPCAAIVKSIDVVQEQKIDKGDILVTFE